MYFYHQIVHYLLAYFAPESLAYFHRNNQLGDKKLMPDVASKEDLEGFYTINEILRKYNISRQCFFLYRKLVPLKKSTRMGRFDRFKKVKVNEFFLKIAELKEKQPHLFHVNIKKAA